MSGRKSNLQTFKILSSVSMSSTVTSSATNILFLDNVGIQHNWSGSPVGTFTVEVSADFNQDDQGRLVNAGNWITLTQPDGTPFVIVAAGVTGQGYFDITQTSSPWMRSVFTASSGSGFLSTFVTAKMV